MYSNLVFNNDKELNINLIKETLQRSLITQTVKNNSSNVEINEIWKWATFIGFDLKRETLETKNRFELDVPKEVETLSLVN